MGFMKQGKELTRYHKVRNLRKGRDAACAKARWGTWRTKSRRTLSMLLSALEWSSDVSSEEPPSEERVTNPLYSFRYSGSAPAE